MDSFEKNRPTLSSNQASLKIKTLKKASPNQSQRDQPSHTSKRFIIDAKTSKSEQKLQKSQIFPKSRNKKIPGRRFL
jgi:hypothetical protein